MGQVRIYNSYFGWLFVIRKLDDGFCWSRTFFLHSCPAVIVDIICNDDPLMRVTRHHSRLSLIKLSYCHALESHSIVGMTAS